MDECKAQPGPYDGGRLKDSKEDIVEQKEIKTGEQEKKLDEVVRESVKKVVVV